MSESTWLLAWCQYEGPSLKRKYGGPNSRKKGEDFQVLVQTDDFREAVRMIRDNKPLISDFVEHSVQQDPTVERQHTLESAVQELYQMGGVKCVISHNEQVYSLSDGEVVKHAVDE